MDADNLERAVEQQRDAFMQIAANAKGRGCIHHDFYRGDGEVVVVDEWETPEAFQSFWDDQGPAIGQLMASAGIQGEPAPPSFHQKLALGDGF